MTTISCGGPYIARDAHDAVVAFLQDRVNQLEAEAAKAKGDVRFGVDVARGDSWDQQYFCHNGKIVKWSKEQEAFFKPWCDLGLSEKIPIEPGEGYEFLPHSTKVEPGDEFWFMQEDESGWHRSENIGTATSLPSRSVGPYRRKIKAKAVHPMCAAMAASSHSTQRDWCLQFERSLLAREFTCPKCGSHMFGTSHCLSPFPEWIGHCHGNELLSCDFTWNRQTQDHEVMKALPAVVESAPISPEVPQAQRRSLPNAVMQTTPTNCFSACVATVLGIPITEVPIACDGAWWDWDAFQEWLAGRGLQAIEMTFENGGTLYPVRRAVRCILTGPSPRECTTGRHAIVGDYIGLDGFELLHDPHESQMWLDGEPTHAVFFVHLRSPAAAESPPISAEEAQAHGMTTPATPSAAVGADEPGAGDTEKLLPCPFCGESPDDWVMITDPEHVIRRRQDECRLRAPAAEWGAVSYLTGDKIGIWPDFDFRCRRKDLPPVLVEKVADDVLELTDLPASVKTALNEVIKRKLLESAAPSDKPRMRQVTLREYLDRDGHTQWTTYDESRLVGVTGRTAVVDVPD